MKGKHFIVFMNHGGFQGPLKFLVNDTSRRALEKFIEKVREIGMPINVDFIEVEDLEEA